MSRGLVVAGVMSGTSADGVDVALARIGAGAGGPRIKLLAHESFAYPQALRACVLAAMDAKQISVAELARLNWRLGACYADCVNATLAKHGAKADLIGMHGQTIYHQAEPQVYAGKATRATWQLGEAAVVRERCGVPVVSDFRPADMAAGGQGAPLVPMLDFTLFRHATCNRVLLNLGGIANMTVMAAGAQTGTVLAFDSGPANMVLDALAASLLGKPFDRGGRAASRGRAIEAVAAQLMADRYFKRPAPKSCGREQYGEAYVLKLLKLTAGARVEDVLATAAEVTVRSIVKAYHDVCLPHFSQSKTEVVAAGGGVRNAYLMGRLQDELAPARVMTTDAMGVPAQAKEALAFALLAWLSWHRLPGNIASATGAARGVVLGKVSY